MTDSFWLLGTAGCAYLGFLLLALSQKRHWNALAGAATRRPVRPLRGVGAALLVLSLAAAIIRDGASFGILLWATLMSLTAMVVALTLTYRPRWLRPCLRQVPLTSKTPQGH